MLLCGSADLQTAACLAARTPCLLVPLNSAHTHILTCERLPGGDLTCHTGATLVDCAAARVDTLQPTPPGALDESILLPFNSRATL